MALGSSGVSWLGGNPRGDHVEQSLCAAKCSQWRHEAGGVQHASGGLLDVAGGFTYTPTIPDAATGYYLNHTGLGASDPHIIWLISLAAQKFISHIANDVLQHAK